jgi:hypothetical protein
VAREEVKALLAKVPWFVASLTFGGSLFVGLWFLIRSRVAWASIEERETLSHYAFWYAWFALVLFACLVLYFFLEAFMRQDEAGR